MPGTDFVDHFTGCFTVCLYNSVFQMFERTIRCSIAKDNGRAPEFIKKKVYKDKSKCYECGVCQL